MSMPSTPTSPRSTEGPVRLLVPLASGALFAVGLAVSGMCRPEKVLGFLDFFGAWDASLAFVMGGAVLVHFLAQRLARRMSAPLYAPAFPRFTRDHLDAPLLVGAALFGVGWGLVGYCPGPAIVSFGAAARDALLFLPAMALGMVVYRLYSARHDVPKPDEAAPDLCQ